MNPNRRLGIGYTTTIALVGLAGTASLVGVLVPGLYAEDALAAAMRGQDFATLVALPLLVLALRQMRRGSPRATVGTLALEHRTQPTDAAARRRFARYWLAIRPGGAFVTRQLLKAVARRAERSAGATESATQLPN